MPDQAEFYQLGQQITDLTVSSTDSLEMLGKIAQQLATTFRVDFCAVIAGIDLIDQPIGFWSKDNSAPPEATQILSDPVIAPNLAANEPVAQSNLAKTESQLEQSLGIKAVLQLTTSFRGVPNGIVLLGCSQARRWKNADKQRLQIVSASVATAFANLRLQQQSQIVNQYELLLKEFNQIRYSSNLNSFYKLALAAIASALQVDSAWLVKLKYKNPLLSRTHSDIPQGTAEVVSQWLSENSAPSTLSASFELSQSTLWQKAWQNAPLPLAIANQNELKQITALEQIADVFSPNKLSALLIVPILGSQSSDSNSSLVIGFLILAQHDPRNWQANEIELVKWVATQVSTAIISNQTLRRVQSLVDERTTQLRLSLDVQAKLSEKMRHQIEELRRLNQVKDDFLANLSDALKHPLTKIKMAIKMLKIAPSKEQGQRYLNILESECEKEINLVNDLLTLHSLESNSSQFQLQRLDLVPILEDLVDSFRQRWADKGLKITVEYGSQSSSQTSSSPSLILYSDVETLRRILLELLTNAGKFSAPQTTVQVIATKRIEPDQEFVLSVANTGVGISHSEQTLIFERFQRGKNASQGTEQGTGLGLALVKLLVQQLNGTIKVASSPLDDLMSVTTFTLTLPQSPLQQLESN